MFEQIVVLSIPAKPMGLEKGRMKFFYIIQFEIKKTTDSQGFYFSSKSSAHFSSKFKLH